MSQRMRRPSAGGRAGIRRDSSRRAWAGLRHPVRRRSTPGRRRACRRRGLSEHGPPCLRCPTVLSDRPVRCRPAAGQGCVSTGWSGEGVCSCVVIPRCGGFCCAYYGSHGAVSVWVVYHSDDRPVGLTTHSGSSNSPSGRISQKGAALRMMAATSGLCWPSMASRCSLLSQLAMAIRVRGSPILRCSSVPRAPGARWMISLARTQASAYSSAVWPSLMWTSNMYFIAPFALSAHGIDQYRKSFTGRLADLLLYCSVHFVTTRGRTMGWIMTLIIGGIVGWLASIIMKTNEQMGLIANIIVGIIGSVLGFWIAGLLGFEEGGAIIRFIIAIGGAVLLILILRAIGVFKKA